MRQTALQDYDIEGESWMTHDEINNFSPQRNATDQGSDLEGLKRLLD